MKFIFTFVKDRLLKYTKRNDHFSKIKFHIYYGLHNRLLSWYHGEYKSVVHGVEIVMPAEHLLPIYVAASPLQETPIIELGNKILQKDGVLNYIDIGANIGDTILFLDHNISTNNILAIEGSDHFYPYLEKNIKALTKNNKFSLEKIYLSDKSGAKKVKKTEDYGTGSLMEATDGEQLNFMSLDDLLTTKYADVQWNFIKLDTDGFDYMILRGTQEYLTRNHPAVFFEYDAVVYGNKKENPLAIFTFLESCGYTDLTFYNNWGENFLSCKFKDTSLIEQLLLYNTTYHRFHFDIFATRAV